MGDQGSPGFHWASFTAAWLVEVTFLKGRHVGCPWAQALGLGFCMHSTNVCQRSDPRFVVGTVRSTGVAAGDEAHVGPGLPELTALC